MCASVWSFVDVTHHVGVMSKQGEIYRIEIYGLFLGEAIKDHEFEKPRSPNVNKSAKNN